MKSKLITLTCDFGDTFACAQLEAVIDSINPQAKFLLASNQITPFSIIEGAFTLEKFYPLTPEGSIHIGVVDPGVGSARRGIIIKTKNYYFIGPDNGLLYPASQMDGIKEVYMINESTLGNLSNTFHGRDVFAKVAALISKGQKLSTLGSQIDSNEIVKLDFKKDQVVHIDPYGNIKLSTPLNGHKKGDQLKVKIKKKTVSIPFVKTFADVKPGQFLVYHGSHQTLEIAQNLGSANAKLRLVPGDVVEISSVK